MSRSASRMEFSEFLRLLPSIKEDCGIQKPVELKYDILTQAEYKDLALLLRQTLAEFEIEKVLPYSCHNADQTRLIETKRQTKSENDKS